jgi:hypothetical protein
MSDAIRRSLIRREPALAELLTLLDALPRFDPSRKAREVQGDIPEVQQAEKLYHTINKRHQRRTTTDNGKPTVERDLVLVELFQLDSWQNYRKLLSHSTVGRERKSRANKRHHEKVKQGDPKAWFESCRKKRQARLDQWERANGPRLLRVLAAAEQQSTELDSRRLRYEVLNALETRYVSEGWALHEYHSLLMRVLLGMYTSNPTPDLKARLEKLAPEVWDEHPLETLEREIAAKHSPITTDWSPIDVSDSDQDDPDTSD